MHRFLNCLPHSHSSVFPGNNILYITITSIIPSKSIVLKSFCDQLVNILQSWEIEGEEGTERKKYEIS